MGYRSFALAGSRPLRVYFFVRLPLMLIARRGYPVVHEEDFLPSPL